MYTEQFDNRHKIGIVRLSGSNAGLLYCNERQVMVEVPAEEGGEPQVKPMWEYDVYEIEDARNPGKAKSEAIGNEHPFGDEQKIVRKALAKVLKKLGDYDTDDFAEFKRYNEFAEAIGTDTVKGSVVAPDPTEEELLEKAKTAKIAEIDKYNSSANVNAFTVNGIPMWLDFDLRSRLKNSIDAAEAEGRTELTKNYGGMTFTYTIALWRQMFTVVENYAGDCQNVSEAHKAAVSAMADIAEVEAFDVTTGYPSNPAF